MKVTEVNNVIPHPSYPYTDSFVTLRTGIRMHYVEALPPANQKKRGTIVMVHGFPDCWYGYRKQIGPISMLGFHVIVPDQRGYGQTDISADVNSYRMELLIDDNLALLDALNIRKAIFIGHDWGGTLVWNMAHHFPERMVAVIGICTPFYPPNPKKNPFSSMLKNPGRFDYQVWFQKEEAEIEYNKNVYRTIKANLRGCSKKDKDALYKGANINIVNLPPTKKKGMMSGLANDVDPSEILREEELNYYTQSFKRSLFRGALNWYRNVEENWKWNCKQAGKKIMIPSLMISASDDPILKPSMTKHMPHWIPDLCIEVVDGAGHWVLFEQPDKINLILGCWLLKLTSKKKLKNLTNSNL